MSEILYIPDLARKLGRTETGIRQAAYRRSRSVPPAMKHGNRYTWRLADVERWLDEQRVYQRRHG